jgi:hypothetical protein
MTKPDSTVPLDPNDPLVQRAMARAFPDRTQDAQRLMAALREERRIEQEEAALEGFEPFTVHVVNSGLTVRFTENDTDVLLRGQEIQVGKEMYRVSLDGNGKSIYDYTDEEQVKRWGEVKIHRGPWPAGTPRLPEEHSLAWQTAKQAALKAAYAIPDRVQRTLAIQAAVDMYGEPDWNPGALSVHGGG